MDDSKTVRRMLVRLFEPFQCTLSQAANGEEGLVVATSEKPDLILLDYNMPVMDGLTMMQRLREDVSLRHTPVIMLTAEAGAKQIAAAARLGARDYITKPFQEDLLLSKTARIIPLVLRPSGPSSIEHAPDTTGGQAAPPSAPELKAP